jgi:hypothetical protein
MVEERRGRPRFLLQLPVMLKVRQDGKREVHGTAENVSLTGVLLSTDADISVEARVELTMALIQPATPPYKLLLSNSGRVVRVEAQSTGKVIAIECDHPFDEVTAT